MTRRTLKPAAEKLCVGRPVKTPPANAAEIIKATAAGGATVKGIANACGCSAEILNRWLDEDASLREAIDAGRECERKTLHNALYRTATEGSGKDALIAAMFLLKARHGYREGDQQEQANRVNVTFNIPAALPAAEYIEVSNGDGTEVQRIPTTPAVPARRV